MKIFLFHLSCYINGGGVPHLPSRLKAISASSASWRHATISMKPAAAEESQNFSRRHQWPAAACVIWLANNGVK